MSNGQPLKVKRLGSKVNQGTHTKARKSVTYRLPEGMKDAMLERIIQDKYGLRGKSRWVSEALEEFLKDRSWKDQVLDVDMVKNNNDKDVIYLEPELRELLKDKTLAVYDYARDLNSGRQEHVETLNVSDASVIRAAINWRLFGIRTPDLSYPAGLVEQGSR